MQRSVFILQPVAAVSCTLPCSLRLNVSRSLLIYCLVRSVSETRSSASTSSSLFILTEKNLFNKPAFVKADIRLKYQAICCSINQSVLYNISGRCRLLNSIFGKPYQRRLTSYQFPPLSGTRRGDTSLLSEKNASAFCVFQGAHPKGPSKAVHLACEGLFVRVFASGPTLNVPTPYRLASFSLFPLALIKGGFFCQPQFLSSYVKVLLEGSKYDCNVLIHPSS